MQSTPRPKAESAVPSQVITGICGVCPEGCGVRVEVVDGRIQRLAPLANHPLGIVCTRGAYASEIVHSPDRLLYPLARTGPKGTFAFERTTWDAALDAIAKRLLAIKDRYGPESLAVYVGRGGFEQSITDVWGIKDAMPRGASSVLFGLGSPNAAGNGSVCATSAFMLAPMATLGIGIRSGFADFANARLIVCWGANPATDSPPNLMRQIVQAQRRGARLLTIDHMRSEIAAQADRWVPIRSGTDGALALSMIQVVIEEDLYDHEFVEEWTQGFGALREYVQQFEPEAAERITGVPAQTIREIAREIATARHATLHSYTGLEYTNSGVQNIRATLILWAITGNLDVPGGYVFRMPQRARFPTLAMEPPPGKPPIGADRYPLFYQMTRAAQMMEMPRAILHDDPYPVRALIVDGASILTGYPNPARWRQAYQKLELLVVIDRFPNADCDYADYVLPATTYFENESYQRHASGFVQLRQRVIEPLGEARSDYLIFGALADRLGYGHLYPRSEQDLLDSPSAVTRPWTWRPCAPIPRVSSCRSPPWSTASTSRGCCARTASRLAHALGQGRDHLNFAGAVRLRGAAGLCRSGEGPLQQPELARQYPLVLNTGARIFSTFRSQHLNIPGLVNLQPQPLVLIHPDAAAARGIVDGQQVEVLTARGKAPFVARVTDRVLPGAVEVNVGGGNPLAANLWRQANANLLTDDENRDPISGFPVFKALLCDVQPAD